MRTRRTSHISGARALVGLVAATALLVAATGLLAACTGAASPAAVATSSAGPSPSAGAPAPSAITANPGAATILTVAWGMIWDRLPAGFPLPSDAEPAQPADPVAGPSSGTFTTSLGVEDAALRIMAALKAAGWSVEAAATGEDGSRGISAVGASPACQSLVTVRPLGSMHFVSIYYGAGCPRP